MGKKRLEKMRTLSEADKRQAEMWLLEAQRNLGHNEFYRVKKLCGQVIRRLRRKKTEGGII